MRVVFNTLTIQNLLSFGNNETVIDFSQGLNLITGSNGAGKSSALLDAISFALFDKPYRKINKSELINRKNKKNLKVSCDFSVNGTEYRIVRGLKCKDVDLEFYIDGIKQKMLSSKSLSQEEIEDHIGIDYKLFKQIISLSINHNKPFLTLPAGEKRELTEKFLNIDAVPLMNKKAKEILKDLKIKKDMTIHSIDMLADVLKSEKKHIAELTASKKTFDEDKKKDLFEVNEKIDLHKRNLKQLKADAREKKKELDALDTDIDISSLREEKDALIKTKSNSEYDIRNAVKILDALDEYDVCPTCKSKLTKKHKEEEINLQNSIIENAETKIAECEKDLIAVRKKITDAESVTSDANDLRYSIKYIKNQYTNIEGQVEKLTADKEKITNREFVVDLTQLKKEYNAKMKEYKDNKADLEAIKEDITMHTKIIEILSDSGVKSYIFEQLIPVLNKSVNYYLNIFELPIYIEFDNAMKDNIKTSTNFNSSVSYMSFSEGEKKKIDMAILLSFIDVTKKIANWNCNLLIIDELLDSSIDDDGLEKLLESLEKMVINDKNLGVYIISHRFKAEYKHFFNSMIEVKKNTEGFSRISTL